VPEDAPLELTNKILRSMRSFPALVGAGALSWLAPPTLVGTAFFLGTGTDLSREVLNSIEDVVLASLSIVLGTLVSTAVSVLRDRQEKIRCCMLREASLLDTLAQQLVKLFRYDKARLKRVTTVLERYVEEKRKSIRKSTVYGYRDYYAHWDGQQKRSLAILDVVAECLDNQIAGPKYGFSPSSSTAAIYQCEVLVFELNQVRQEYRSALNASLPRGVFTTIIALMVAILYTFACRAAAMGSFAATRQFLSETVGAVWTSTGELCYRRVDGVSARNLISTQVVRVLFSLTATSFFAILQVLSDLADTYTGANEQFRVDARILDGATFRTAWKSTSVSVLGGDHRRTQVPNSRCEGAGRGHRELRQGPARPGGPARHVSR
jgi:hypothetical protein